MGMKDLRLKAKWEVSYVSCEMVFAPRQGLPVWRVCENPSSDKVIKEQNRPMSVRKEQVRQMTWSRQKKKNPKNRSFCFERIFEFKVNEVKIGHERITYVTMYFLSSICLGFCAVWVNGEMSSGQVRVPVSLFEGGVNMLHGHWLYWLFIINTA